MVAVAVAGVVVLSLRYIHPLPELLILAFAPGLVALLFARSERDRFIQNARVAVLATGMAGAAGLIVSAGYGNVVAVLIGAVVSFLLMMAMATLGSMVIDRVQGRRSAWR
jgi:hypothetical protein